MADVLYIGINIYVTYIILCIGKPIYPTILTKKSL